MALGSSERPFFSLQSQIEKDFKITVPNLDKVVGNKQHEVFLGDSAVVRVAQDVPSKFLKEVWAYKLLKDYGIPCAEVLGYAEDPPTIKKPTIILSKVPGKTMEDSIRETGDEETYFRKAGKLLRAMHEIPLDGFGILQVDADGGRGTSTTWRAYWESKAYDLPFRELRDNDVINAEEYTLLSLSYSFAKHRQLSQGAFLHGDYHQKNILFEDGEISGVIDLSNSLAGDPMYDVANALFYQHPSQQEAFLEGYGDAVDAEAARQYLLLFSGQRLVSRYAKGEERRVRAARERFQTALTTRF